MGGKRSKNLLMYIFFANQIRTKQDSPNMVVDASDKCREHLVDPCRPYCPNCFFASCDGSPPNCPCSSLCLCVCTAVTLVWMDAFLTRQGPLSQLCGLCFSETSLLGVCQSRWPRRPFCHWRIVRYVMKTAYVCIHSHERSFDSCF